jgi:hypothetical protein
VDVNSGEAEIHWFTATVDEEQGAAQTPSTILIDEPEVADEALGGLLAEIAKGNAQGCPSGFVL